MFNTNMTFAMTVDFANLLNLYQNASPQQRDAAVQMLQGEKNWPGIPKLLTFTEVAERLGLSRTTIWRLVKQGDLKITTLATGARRVPETELLALVKTD